MEETKRLVQETHLLNKRLKSISKHVKSIPRDTNGTINDFKDKKVRGLYKLMYSEALLHASYYKIRSKISANSTVKGSMQHQYGVDKNPDSDLDGINIERIHLIACALRNESFQFKPTTQVLIPKPGKKKKRPLGLPEPTDKIVQRAMATILSAIFEEGEVFSNFSHAYRPKRGAHSCMEMIENNFQSSSYIIEADIKGYFPSIAHSKLIEILKRYIDDQRFINLVYKALKSRTITLVNPEKPKGKWYFVPSGRTGTPQGSIVSPILSNIYLHELDTWMAGRCKSRPKIVRNPQVVALKIKNRTARNLMKDFTLSQVIELKKAIRKRDIECRKQLSFVPSNVATLRYIRYCDDFIIGVEGSYIQSQQVKAELSEFMISLGLTLDDEKTLITNIRTDHAKFLGFHIYQVIHQRTHKYPIKSSDGKIRQVKRRGRSSLRINMNRKHVLTRLKEKGFIINLQHQQYRAISLSNKVFLEDKEIVSYFASVIRGLNNYYSGVFNRGDLGQVQHLLKRSCAMTLAHKHKTSSRAIFKKHGPTLTIKWSTLKGTPKSTKLELLESFKTSDRKWSTTKDNLDNFFEIRVNYRSKSNLFEECAIIGCNSINAEMHHVNHIRKLGEKYKGFHQVMQAANRKQIPVCKKCHKEIHDGKSMKDLLGASFINSKTSNN